MHLKISISASSAMAKCVHYVDVSQTEETICDSDSQEQCISADSDVETADDLSDDSDNSVPTGQLWHYCRSEVRAEIHNFSAPRPRANCCAVPHISASSPALDCF